MTMASHDPFILPGSASLVEDLDKKLLVTLRDGRHLIGYLRCVDQFGNLVMHETFERILVQRKFGDIPLGIFIIRGENVVLIGEIDPFKEDDIALERVTVEEILAAQNAEKEQKKRLEETRTKALTDRGLSPRENLNEEY